MPLYATVCRCQLLSAAGLLGLLPGAGGRLSGAEVGMLSWSDSLGRCVYKVRI